MLLGDDLTGLGNVEHVQYDLFVPSVLATMDGADHFDDSLTFVEGAFVAVIANDGQIALLNDAVIDDVVVMPAGHCANGEHQPVHHQLRTTCW